MTHQWKRLCWKARLPSSCGVARERRRSRRKRCGLCIQRSGGWPWPTSRRSAKLFFQKAQALDWQMRRKMMDKDHPSQSVGAQCRPLLVPRSSLRYKVMDETAMNPDQGLQLTSFAWTDRLKRVGTSFSTDRKGVAHLSRHQKSSDSGSRRMIVNESCLADSLHAVGIER